MSTSENKSKARDGYVRMYECGKYFLYSTYERACVAQGTNIGKMNDIV